MAGTSYIYKPQTRKGPVFIDPFGSTHTPPQIKLANGQIITAVRGDQAGGSYDGHEGRQFVFPKDVLGQQGAQLIYNGQVQPLGNTNLSYRGGSLGALSESSKGALGDFSSMGGGGFGGFGATPVGQYGFAPANLMGSFPSPAFATFNPIQAAPYKFTDVKKFAEGFGDFTRKEIGKNYEQSKGFALDTLATELESLQKYTPAAAALKRSETSLDNIFNQQQRTQQLESTLPGVRGQLAGQGQRAQAYAEGRIPDSVQDRAFEVGVRSSAADIASGGGFGATSSVARKASDLMSAERRIGLSQYGDQLLGQNIQQRVATELAPTSYSNAGQQINVNPPVSFSQLSSNIFGQVNQLSTVPATTALGTTVQQQQFSTNLEQGTRTFNAQNQFAESQFNAQAQNQFSMAQFGYGVSLAGAYAGAAQTNLNTGVAFQQQADATKYYEQMFNTAQDANQTASIAQGIGTILTAGSALYDQFAGPSDGGAPATAALSSPSSAPSNFQFDPGGAAANFDAGTSAPSFSAGSEAPAFSMEGSAPSQISLSPEVSSFVADTGASAGSFSAPVIRAATTRSAGVLSTAGVYDQPVPNSMPVSVGPTGNTLYSSIPLMRNASVEPGAKLVQGVQTAVAPFNALTEEDNFNLSAIASGASDVATLASLTDAADRGDAKGFINTALTAVKIPATDYVTSGIDDAKTKEQAGGGISSAYTAHQLYQNWGVMSPAQKALGLAALGISGYKTVSGENLAKATIIQPEISASGEVLSPGVNLGEALGLLQSGYNAYSLVNNWGQINALQKVAGTTGSASQMASLAQSMGLLGNGVQGGTVAGVTAESLSSIGATAVPQHGIGAISVPAGSNIPAGYTTIASEGGSTVAVPTANASSAAVGYLQTAAGVASLAAGAYTVYKGWGGSGSSGATNGLLGGSAMAAGLYALGATNPLLLAGVVAVSVLGNATGGNKSESQTARDSVRGRLKELGIVDNEYNAVLADGLKANLGIDGKGGRHSVADASKLSDGQRGKVKDLSAYDIDYTNDLDYAAGMGGVALSRLISGGVGTHIDQIGGQIGNGSLQSVGFGKEMTPENYDKVMRNQRLMFSKAGIKSKADAFQLANQAFAEGRLDATQHVTTMQALNMVFEDNSFGTARKLMDGRFNGIKTLDKLPENPLQTKTAAPSNSSVYKKLPQNPPVFTRRGANSQNSASMMG